MIEVFEFIKHFLYPLLTPKTFAEAPAELAPPTISEPEQEEDVVLLATVLVLLSLVHQSVIQQQSDQLTCR